MDKGLRNTVFGILGTAIIAFLGVCMQINQRISALETQVQNDRQLYLASQDKTEKLMDKINDIQVKVTRLSTMIEKGDKNE